MNLLAKTSATLVLVVAVAVGLVGEFSPSIFLRIPHLGFIPWAITGNPMPPYFDESVYSEQYFDQWAEEGDCILASGPKSGTVWVHNIIHLLKNDGNDNFTYLGSEHNGLTEYLVYPEQTVEIRINETRTKRELAKKRPVPEMTHFSHMSPSRNLYGMNVQKHPKIKYLVTLRNLKEVARSFYAFINNHSPEFRARWGGFPPPFSSPEETVDFCINNKDFILGHAKGWWNVRNESNVMLVHFSDLKSKLKDSIERIASFLEIPVSAELMNTTLRKSSFEYMKHRVNTEHPEVYGVKYGRPGEDPYVGVVDHIHTGAIGGTREFFTPEMETKFEAAIAEYLGDHSDLIKWLESGGSY